MVDTTINALGLGVIIGVLAFLLLLLAISALFLLRRERQLRLLREEAGAKGYGRDLVFHSPDDAPRSFKQYGFVDSALGFALLTTWLTVFVLGYVYMVIFCWLAYAPQFGAPTAVLEAFGGWNGLLGPWLVIFTLIHALAMALIRFRDVLRVSFMIPVGDLGKATHVLIEEAKAPVFEESEEESADPDESKENWLVAFGRRLLGFGAKLGRGSSATLVRVSSGEAQCTRHIDFTCVNYIYHAEDDSFHPVGCVRYTAPEAHILRRRGGMTQAAAEEAMASAGKNEIHVHVSGIGEALVNEFADFTYVVNSIGTWSYMVFSSWNIGIMWLLITLGSGIFRSLCIIRPSQKKIAELAKLHTECQVLRDGKWVTIRASDIVLGDLVRVADESAKLPCDGVVVEGSLVVDESMLTGEPMPIQKMSVEDSEHAAITKKNIAYAGTLCLQSTGPSEGKAVVLASAVGALTTRGQLVRMVLFPSSVRFKYNDQLPTVYLIMFLYMILLTLIYIFFVDLGTWVALYLLVINTAAMCLSPMLPVSMVMGQSVSANRLASTYKINCLQPGRIPIAGKISTMVFDKTGTITKEGMDFDSVLPIVDGVFRDKVEFDSDEPESAVNRERLGSHAPERLHRGLACCHTVTSLADGTLVGNQVEVSMVRTVGWKLQGDVVTSPGEEQLSLEVVKKLDFDTSRMTSGAVVRCRQTGRLEVYVKGSYEQIQRCSLAESVPSDYEATTRLCARNGYYTLGIATKALPTETTEKQLADLTRDSLESGLTIRGLLLFRNEMKRTSPQAIADLKAGSVRSVICTGDNALTGISIGRQCGIVSMPRVLLLDMKDGKLVCFDPEKEDDGGRPWGPAAHAEANPREVQFAVVQAAWRHLHAAPAELEPIWARIVVFARMKPEDKINVVKFLQGRGLVVGMCGDGGNDCGGLRAAHAGLALSDAEASMVAPFSTGRDGKSLQTAVDLVREGRACLSTNLATFQYFIVYGFTLTSIRTILVLWAALSLSEYVWITMDLGIGILMVWTMTQSKATERLSSFRPTATLLGPRTVSGIVVPYVTCIIAYFAAEGILWNEDWYVKVNPLTDLHLLPRMWMLRGDTYDSPIGMLMLFLGLVTTAYVNTYGGAFRRNIAWNWGVNLVHATFIFMLFWLCLTSPSQFNCIYRVNCDTAASIAARDLTVLTAFSAGGVGGCFLGPQVMVWQQELEHQGHTGNDLWLPVYAKNRCLPPSNATVTPYGSELISSLGCSGPNNCWSTSFRWSMAAVMVLYMAANHGFVKLVLQGPVSERLRRRQRQRDRELYGDA